MRLALPILLLLALPLAAPRAQSAERRTLAGSDVAIYDLVGRVRVVRGTGDAVTVDVTRRGADAARLRVETGPIRGASTLRVVYPGDRVRAPQSGGSTTLRVRDDGTFSDAGRRGDDDDDDDDDRGRGGRVTISSRGGLDAAADLVVSVPAGRRVRLYVAVGEVMVGDVSADLVVDAAAADVTATGTRGTLRIDTGSGDVAVTGTDGDLDVDTGSGSVRVRDAKGGVLKIDTGSGSVTGDGLEATRLDVDVGSGTIDVRGVRAHDVRLDSGSGDVACALAAPVRSMVIDTGSGEVVLRVPATLGAELEIDTGSGGIESELPITVHRKSEDHLSGRIGNGEGRIRIDTGSGGVRIAKSGV